jgi:post-segregation antitoxin (ccd killing protein)
MPYNQEAFDSAAREGVLAIEIHMRGAPEAAVRLAQKEYVSGLEKSRITAVAQDDPVSAMAMLDASGVLLPADRAALRASLEPKARKMEVQSIVDGIVAENGIENRFEILKAIHANYSGDTEDALIAEYNQRHGEYAAEENRKAAEAQAYRAQFYQGVYDAYQRDFKYIPMDEIDRWYDAGYIDSGQRDRLIGYNGNVASISYQENRVRAEHPDWTPEQVQIGARGNLGITPEVMEDAQKFYMRGIVTGTVTMAEVNDAHANGFLTNRQKDQLTEFEKGYTAEAKGMIGGASRDLNAALDKLSGATLSPEAREAAVDAFMTGLAGLTPADREKLPESLRNLQTQALVKAAQTDHENMLNKEDLNTEDAYDNLQDAYDKNLRRLTEPRANSYEFTPEAQRLFAPDPPPPGDEARAFNSALFQASGKYKGLPYELGGKGVGAGGIDCSGLVSVAMPNAMKKVNEQAGQEVFGKDAMDAVRGSAADILRKVEQATGTQAAVNPPLLHYRPGMIIALGPRAGERRNGRHKDITHVSMVIQDNAGRLMVYESNSYQGGVVIRPLEAALNEYRGRPVYAADPMLMARGRKAALPSPAPRPPISSLDSVGKPPAQPEGQK